MAGGTYIQEPTKEKIRQIYLENDTLAPKEIWYKLQNRVEQGERIPSLSYVQKFCREELFPNYKKMQAELKDTPWNTATLNIEPINPEVIPWLIGLQVSRKKFLSKPITIREAKWFNRFFGLRNDIIIKDSDVDNDPNLKKTALSHVIAMWAQIYAYREITDTVASVKESDYTDLDRHLVELDFEDVYNTSVWRTQREIEAFAHKEKHTEDDLEKFYSNMARSSMDIIKYWEIVYLRHSLGDPDMPDESMDMYSRVLLRIADKKSLNKSLQKSTYRKRLTFFARLRQWCNDNPFIELTDYNFDDPDAERDCLYSMVSTILNDIEGEVKESTSISQIASTAAEGFDRRFGGTVDKERKDGKRSSA